MCPLRNLRRLQSISNLQTHISPVMHEDVHRKLKVIHQKRDRRSNLLDGGGKLRGDTQQVASTASYTTFIEFHASVSLPSPCLEFDNSF